MVKKIPSPVVSQRGRRMKVLNQFKEFFDTSAILIWKSPFTVFDKNWRHSKPKSPSNICLSELFWRSLSLYPLILSLQKDCLMLHYRKLGLHHPNLVLHQSIIGLYQQMLVLHRVNLSLHRRTLMLYHLNLMLRHPILGLHYIIMVLHQLSLSLHH